MTGAARRRLVAEVGRFVRANLSSTVATGIEWVLVTGLLLVGVHYLAAAGVGALTGAVTDFALKRHWAFDRQHKAGVHHEALRYGLVAGGSLVLNLALAYLLVDGLRLHKVPGVIAASLVVGFVWNYPLHRWFVFRGAPPRLAAARRPADEGA